MDVTKEWLEREYVAGQRGLRDLAAEAAVSHQHISNKLKEYGIPRRGPRARVPQLYDAALLRRLYVERQMSTLAIAAHFKCDQSAVAKALRRAGVVMRKRGALRRVAAES